MNKRKIEYMDFSWNPLVMRCTPVSEGCANCWHLAMADRLAGNATFSSEVRAAYAGNGPPVLVEERLSSPLRRKKPAIIGVQFMGDLFHDDVPEQDIFRILRVTRDASWHIYQILTRRPGRMIPVMREYYARLRSFYGSKAEEPQRNLWLGVTVENQRTADERRTDFEAIPAAIKYVSYEPALGPIDWAGWEFVDQIISGGESGPSSRPSHPDWHRTTRDFCQGHDIAYFLKQWGAWMPVGDFDPQTRAYHYCWQHAEPYKDVVSVGLDGRVYNNNYPPENGWHMARVGKKQAGHLLDGQEWHQWPNVGER